MLFGGEEVFFKSLHHLAQAGKFASDLFAIVGESGHAHETANAHMREGMEIGVLEHFEELVFMEAEFRRFAGDVYLEQAILDDLFAGCALIHFAQQFEAVYGVDERCLADYIFDFVALQVANEMPLNIRGQQGAFVSQFLGAIFAKDALAGLIEASDLFG